MMFFDVSNFRQERITHSGAFVEQRNPINGIKYFLHHGKQSMCRFNAIPKEHFSLYHKELEWRFNYRPTQNPIKVCQASMKRLYAKAYLCRLQKNWRSLHRKNLPYFNLLLDSKKLAT